jgi:hypothetical protein
VVKPDAALDALLDEALSRRNFLAHGFFRERAVAFAHGAGRLEMIDELERDHDLFIRTDQAVQEAVSHVLPKIGVNVERMTAQTEAIIREQLDAARARSAAPKSDA